MPREAVVIVMPSTRPVMLTLLAVGLVGLAACGSGNGRAAQLHASHGNKAEIGEGSEVTMRLIAYKPPALTVRAGTSVTWKQGDAGFHTVTSGRVIKDAGGLVETRPDRRFDSGRLAKGKEFSFTFDDAGAFAYFCQIHPATMTGHVTVE